MEQSNGRSTGLRWDEAHDGSPVRLGFAGPRLVAQVAFYDVVAGGDGGWVGYVVGNRVTGRCATPELACRLVEERRMRVAPPEPVAA